MRRGRLTPRIGIAQGAPDGPAPRRVQVPDTTVHHGARARRMRKIARAAKLARLYRALLAGSRSDVVAQNF